MNPGRLGGTGHASGVDIQSLKEFGKFLKVDLGLAEKTVWRYVYEMEKFFGCCEKQPVTRALLRHYLEPLEVEPRNTALKAFRRFFRDFVEKGELVSSFRFIKTPPKLRINLPSKEDCARGRVIITNMVVVKRKKKQRKAPPIRAEVPLPKEGPLARFTMLVVEYLRLLPEDVKLFEFKRRRA